MTLIRNWLERRHRRAIRWTVVQPKPCVIARRQKP